MLRWCEGNVYGSCSAETGRHIDGGIATGVETFAVLVAWALLQCWWHGHCCSAGGMGIAAVLVAWALPQCWWLRHTMRLSGR